MINYDIYKRKNKKKERRVTSITHVANSDSFADVSFLAHYNFDSSFHTFVEAYYVSKGMNEIHELLM